MKRIVLMICCVACFAQDKPPLKTEIADYLQLEIPKKNPFEALKPLSDRFGIPLPSLQKEEVQETSVRVQQRDFRGDVWNDYVLGAGLERTSSLLTRSIAEFLRDSGKEEMIQIKVSLNGSVGAENEIGGDTYLTFRAYQNKNTTIELLGSANLQSNQEWGSSYGLQQKLYAESLENLYFQYSLTKTNNFIEESTLRYGVGYSPFKNFSALIEKEENEEKESSTKASLYYKILF